MPVPPHSSMAPSDEEWPGMLLCMISGTKVWMQFLPILPMYYQVATILLQYAHYYVVTWLQELS